MFSLQTPSPTRRLRQAIAAAPAPEQTSFTYSIRLATTFKPLSTAAAATMAVPCWSSWKTGMFMRSRRRVSIHDGGSVLVVVEDRDVHAPAQAPTADEAVGSLNIFTVDAAE